MFLGLDLGFGGLCFLEVLGRFMLVFFCFYGCGVFGFLVALRGF